MKSILILFAAFVLSSFSETKEVKVTFTEPQMQTVKDNLGKVYEYIDKSNLPMQEARAIMKLIQETYQIVNVGGKIDSLRK